MIRAIRTRFLLSLTLLAVVSLLAVACGESATATPIPGTPTPTSAPEPEPTSTPEVNSPPTADFTWDPPAVPRGDNYTTEFTFTATASDPDGDELTYQWRFTGGRPSTATGAVVVVLFPGRAPYPVTLTVSDGKGGETTVSQTVPLGEAAPEPTATPTPAEETLVIDLAELNDSGQSGTATLTAMGDQTEVVIDVTADISSIQHIHSGSCDELGGVVHDLGAIGDDGTSAILVDASLDSLTSGEFVINLHDKDNPGVYTSCGAISAVGETAQGDGSSSGPY